MITRVVSTLAAVAFGLGLNGCATKDPMPNSSKFAVEFQVTNDDGDALAETGITAEESPIGKTGTKGKLKVELFGDDGQLVPVSIACPVGYAAPEKPAALRLAHTRRVNTTDYQPMRYESTCTRIERDIVLVVRTEGGEGLALQIDGRPSGTINGDGVAQVLLHANRNSKALNVSLDTSARQELRPQNPSRTYELLGRDSVLVFDQTFVTAPKPIYRGGGAKPRRYVPYRVD